MNSPAKKWTDWSSNFKNLYRSDSVRSGTTRRSGQAKEWGQRGHWSLHGAADIAADTCIGGSLWSPPPLTPRYTAGGDDQRERVAASGIQRVTWRQQQRRRSKGTADITADTWWRRWLSLIAAATALLHVTRRAAIKGSGGRRTTAVRV